MAVISRANITRELRPGLAGLLGTKYKRYANEYQELFDIKTSDKAQEEMVMTYGLSLAPTKAEGGAYFLDETGEAYSARFDHITVATGYAITEEAIEDNLYKSEAEGKTEALARAMGQSKEVRGAAVLNTGFSGVTYGDGVSLFNSSHPAAVGGVSAQSNTASTDMSEAGLQAAEIAVNKWNDDRGLKVSATSRKLFIPTDLRFLTFEVLKSDLSTTTVVNGGNGVTNTNKANALRQMGIFPEGMSVNHFITDTNSWYIKTDVPKGLIHFQRRKLSMKMDYQDPFTGNIICTAAERYSFGVGDWRGMYGSAGAS